MFGLGHQKKFQVLWKNFWKEETGRGWSGIRMILIQELLP